MPRPDVPAILVEHDLTFTLYRQLAEREQTAAARAEYERWHRFERHWLSRYDAVWTMSDDDNARALDEGARPGAPAWWRMAWISNASCRARNPPTRRKYSTSDRSATCPTSWDSSGCGTRSCRASGRRFPEARLRVVSGPDPERYWREFMKRDYPAFDPRIEVHAFVEDLRPLYAKAAVVVTPLVVSAGTNIKVMEAMACRKAVVSTPVGCAGLGLVDGQDALIRKESPEFADAIIELLADPRRRQAIAAAARRTVEQRFSWRAIADEAYASYLQIAGSARVR